MAFNLSSSIKSQLSSVTSSISTVTSAGLSQLTSGVNSKINSALSGALPNSLLGNAAGDILGGVTDGLLGQVNNKLQSLIGSAEELAGLANNPLQIVERGAAELFGLNGEKFSTLTELYRDLEDRTAFGDFVDSGYKNPYENAGTSYSRIPNPLRNHNSFNYKITLGVLDAAEYNNPESYRSAGGFKNYVIQSSGGNLDKRFQVFDETAGDGGHAEYYIEDLNFDAVVAPNPNTRVTLGTTMSFTVVEPYSMGNFVQAIIGAASTAGFKNYLDAPFCLKIDFVGWNEAGGSDNANFITRPFFIPIKFINMEFNVTGQGSTYAVSAVPMSESGLSDKINTIQTPIKTTGTFLHEVLETNDNSVTAAINRQIQDLEEAGALAPFDRYVICFPKNRTTLVDALKAGNVDDSAFTTTAEENAQQQSGSSVPLEGATHSADQTLPNIVIKPSTQTFAVLKSFAENVNLMNEIGTSAINVDSNAAGNSSEAQPSGAIDPRTGKVDPAAQTAQTADKAREYQFNQREKITSIIEKMVVQTEYAAEKSTEGATNGLNKWFKIDTQVFIDESPITEAQMGRKPKVYVYSVIPYEVDEAVHLGIGQKASNTEGLKRAAAKEYNYIYSGKNEDVLNFDINFNQAFMQTALAGFGNNAGPRADVDAGKTSAAAAEVDGGAAPAIANDTQTNDDPGGTLEQVAALDGDSPATVSKDIRRQIAEMFHDRITNMTTDMITAEMEIFGDPFFIPQETGNYVAQQGAKPNTTNDGTMTYQQSQVFVDVNFKTPFDYQIKGATMEMPQIVPGFSGLFTVWAVNNSFSKGQFKQTLKLIRSRGRDDPPTSGNTNAIQVDNSVNLNKDQVTSDGTVGQSGQPSTDCMPVSPTDDIRKINPAIAADVAAQLAAPFQDIERQFSDIASSFTQGIDLSNVQVPDLTKVIPRIAGSAIGGAIGGSLGGAIGSAIGSSVEVAGLGDLQSQANAAISNASSAVNTVATQNISGATDAAKARVRSLLG